MNQQRVYICSGKKCNYATKEKEPSGGEAPISTPLSPAASFRERHRIFCNAFALEKILETGSGGTVIRLEPQ